jgi:hypothetical protein
MVALVMASLASSNSARDQNPKSNSAQDNKPRKCLTRFNRKIVDQHEQRYGMSYIPMSVELVLKLLGRAPPDYYELQTPWKEKADGNFRDFNGKTIKGVTFHQQYDLRRNRQFPLAKLFATIDKELKEGRFVIVSLASSSGWHMYVIYDEDAEGDFLAVSKERSRTVVHPQSLYLDSCSPRSLRMKNSSSR